MPFWSLNMVLKRDGIVGRKGDKNKGLIHESRIRLAIWNIGTLTGKMTELVDTMMKDEYNLFAGNCMGR